MSTVKHGTPAVTLRFLRIVRVDDNVRAYHDNRVRVCHMLCEYKGSDGEIYRKSFESKGIPVPPQEGTHDEINRAKKQWHSNG